MTGEEEPLYQRALVLVLEHQKASTSWLQRQLRIGYNSAARFIERMETEGAVGSPDHVGRREVLRPPSSALPGSSISPASPWDRNSGRYDTPSSAPPPLEGEAPPMPARVILTEPGPIEIDSDFGRIAGELVAALGLEGARRTVRSAAETQGVVQPAKSAGSKASHLEQIVERAEGLMAHREMVNTEIRDLFKFAKDIGLDPPSIRACIKAREMDQDKRFESEATLAVYRHALGIEDPDFVVEIPPPAAPPPPRERKLTAKEKAYQETLASVAASRAVLIQ